jgi:hypothetical protein
MKRHLCFIAALGMCLLGLNASADAQVPSPSSALHAVVVIPMAAKGPRASPAILCELLHTYERLRM